MSEKWTFEKMVHPDQRVSVYGYYLIRSNQNESYVAFVSGKDNAQKIAQAPAIRKLLERWVKDLKGLELHQESLIRERLEPILTDTEALLKEDADG